MSEFRNHEVNEEGGSDFLGEENSYEPTGGAVSEEKGSEIIDEGEGEQKPSYDTEEKSYGEVLPEAEYVSEGVSGEKAEEKSNVGFTEGINRSEAEKGVYIITQSRKKDRSFFKKLGAVAAGVAVVGMITGAGIGAGYYLNSVNGVGVISGSESAVDRVDEAAIMPMSYTTNFSGITEVFKAVQNSVVNISMTVNATNMWFETYQATGSGSGIVYKIDGDDVYILTNNHVVEGANTVSVSITGEEQIPASLVGRDAQNEIAVIKVSMADVKAAGIADLKAAKFLREDTSQIGETVLAIGNALGEGKSLTQGILSAKNKTLKLEGKTLTVLQTDAAINPGNSGGALINLDAEVIGINTAKTGATSVEGAGYAIPSYIAVGIADQLIENGTIERPYLGVVCFTINDSFKKMYNLNIDGIFIREVENGSAAQKAGLMATDIITAVNGTPITTKEDLQKIISSSKVGDSLKIDFIRNGTESKSLNVVLEKYQEQF